MLVSRAGVHTLLTVEVVMLRVELIRFLSCCPMCTNAGPLLLVRPPISEAFSLNVEDEAEDGVITGGIAGDRAAKKSKQVGFVFSAFFALFALGTRIMRTCVVWLFLVADHSPRSTFG